MKINGVETNKAEIKTEENKTKSKGLFKSGNKADKKLDDTTKLDKKQKKVKNKAKEDEGSKYVVPPENTDVPDTKIKPTKIPFVITGIICIAAIIFACLSLVKGISGNKKYNEAMENINNVYSQNMTANNVYAKIDVISAQVLDYKDGVCETTYGYVECEEPTTKIIYIFKDLDGILKLFDSKINEGKQFSYVTDIFELPEGAFLITEATEKQVYSTYLNELNEANAVAAEASKQMQRAKISGIVALGMLLITFVLYKIFLKRNDLIPLVKKAPVNEASTVNPVNNTAPVANNNPEEFDDF